MKIEINRRMVGVMLTIFYFYRLKMNQMNENKTSCIRCGDSYKCTCSAEVCGIEFDQAPLAYTDFQFTWSLC